VAAAEAVTTISEFSKKEISKYLPVDQTDVHVIHNGLTEPYLDAARAEPDTPSLSSTPAADGGTTSFKTSNTDIPEQYVLFVGSANPRKNIARLINSFAQLRQETTLPHELVIAGPSAKRIFSQIDVDASAKRDAAVTSVGFVSDSELRALYQGADCFVFPSLYEGFGLPPLEAMAMGTPVVTSNVASLPEICGNAAMYVDPEQIDDIADGIRTVLRDKEFAAKCRARGRDRALQFTWNAAADQFITIARNISMESSV
jgi:glycosyltransferase involved in cell wall biosynthesis